MLPQDRLFTKKSVIRRNRKSNKTKIRPFSLNQREVEQSQLSIQIHPWNNTVEQLDEDLKVDDYRSFHQVMRPIFATAQILGIFPLHRISSRVSGTSTRGIISSQSLYPVIIIILMIIMGIISAYEEIRKMNSSSDFGEQLNKIGHGIFYLNSAFILIFFLRLSQKWMDLQEEWEAMEELLNSHDGDQPPYRCKLYTISCLMTILAVVEHFLSTFNGIKNPKMIVNGSNEIFDESVRASEFRTIPSTPSVFFGALIIFILRKIATFSWNFTDIFIMLVSTGLAEKYKFLNRATLILVKKDGFSIDWYQLREKYATLSILVKKTDECISPLVLLSFTINIYVICLQLYNGLVISKTNSTMILYFFGSFAFLVGKTIAVILSAARINDQSKIFLPEIYRCRTSCFTIETERLQNQLTNDNVALTGMKFFSITRQFLMAVASVIITYEVVLLQANKVH